MLIDLQALAEDYAYMFLVLYLIFTWFPRMAFKKRKDDIPRGFTLSNTFLSTRQIFFSYELGYGYFFIPVAIGNIFLCFFLLAIFQKIIQIFT